MQRAPQHSLAMRSKLFVPGSRPDLFPKAMRSGADGISFDLEDAVAESAKVEARNAVSSFLSGDTFRKSGLISIVRINSLDTEWWENDLAGLVGASIDVINLPKAECAEDVARVGEAIDALSWTQAEIPRLLVNIETPKGLRLASEIAKSSKLVAGLQLGYADLLEPLGISRTNADAIFNIRYQVRMAAAEAGVDVYDGAFFDKNDPQGFERECSEARSLGFTGKSCIFPGQVGVTNRIFGWSDEQIALARKVIAAAEQAEETGVGVFVVDGRMVDQPFVTRARAILDLAAREQANSKARIDGS